MIRHLIAVIIASLALQAVGFAGARAAGDDHDRYCRSLKPVCHLNEHPICICESSSQFSCGWRCVAE